MSNRGPCIDLSYSRMMLFSNVSQKVSEEKALQQCKVPRKGNSILVHHLTKQNVCDSMCVE